ncbi:hypothetical protein ACOMHN_041202 [Nucella lapillus]
MNETVFCFFCRSVQQSSTAPQQPPSTTPIMSGLSGIERKAVEEAIESLTRAKTLRQHGSPHHQVLRHCCRGLILLLPLLASPRCSGRYRDT